MIDIVIHHNLLLILELQMTATFVYIPFEVFS